MSHGKQNDLDPAALHTVSVKALVEFAARSGSLDRKFTPAPTGLQGIEGHNRVTRTRPENYQKELALSIHTNSMLIRGRADGYCVNTHCIEEIKTFYGDFNQIPENHRQLHWAQVKFYGWMLGRQKNVEKVNLALIYFHLKDEKEYRLEECWTVAALENDCLSLVLKYENWKNGIDQRIAVLTPWLNQLAFPFEFHTSQRSMAEAVYKSAMSHRVLLAEAPTGTGKTLAALFPALKTMARNKIDKVFYLTTKTTAKQLALEAIQLIATDATPLRTLELTAREKSCLEPEKACTGDSCPYANNFYEKLEPARYAAAAIPVLNKNTLEQLAHDFQICPFYLGMEMCRWVDVIVGDVNYYFDGNALLLGLTQDMEWQPYLLVDECHNLIERGRMMYSAAINRKLLLSAKKDAPPSLKKSLTRVNKQWLSLIKTLDEKPDLLTTLAEFPAAFAEELADFISQYQEFLQHNPDHPCQHGDIKEFFFSALSIQGRLAEINEDFCIDMQHLDTKAEELTIRNLVPARLLAKRLAFAKGACFFSATLHPMHFYHAMLGLPDDSVHLSVASPFDPTQLTIHITRDLSTRYRDRTASITAISQLVFNQLQRIPGNAIIFFPSYTYLQEVESHLRHQLQEYPVKIIAQTRKMNETERAEFIASFSRDNNILGLAVLGGAFSEGIDLPGDALTGVFVATLGLPQINKVNEYLRDYLQQKFQQGYNFTYLYPGLQKVIQAAGRVIRRKEDTGYLFLLDDRYGQPEIAQLLPDWWQVT